MYPVQGRCLSTCTFLYEVKAIRVSSVIRTGWPVGFVSDDRHISPDARYIVPSKNSTKTMFFCFYIFHAKYDRRSNLVSDRCVYCIDVEKRSSVPRDGGV